MILFQVKCLIGLRYYNGMALAWHVFDLQPKYQEQLPRQHEHPPQQTRNKGIYLQQQHSMPRQVLVKVQVICV